MSETDSEKPNPYGSPSAWPTDDTATPTSDIAIQPPTYVRFGVVAALCMVAIIAYIQRNSIGVAEQAIRADLQLTKQQMGWVMSAFFWSYAIFQIPTGLIGQIWGTRRALSFFVAIFSAVAGLFALAAGMPVLLVSRLGMGIGQAGSFPCAVQSVSHWIPESWRSISTGMLASCMSIGGAVGAALTGVLLPLWGWRLTFLLFCLPGLLFAGWFYWWFRNRPDEYTSEKQRAADQAVAPQQTALPASGEQQLAQQYEVVATSRRIYACGAIAALCGQQVCRAAGYMFFGSWFATYLRETRGVADMEVGLLNSLPLLAIVAGAPTGGMLADLIFQRTGSRRLSRQGVGTVAMLICCLMILVSYPITNAWLAVIAISIGSFFAAFGGPCAYTATIDMGGRYTPVVFSTMNMMGNFGAAIFPVVVPWLLSQGDSSKAGNWNLVLFTFAGLYFAAMIFWLLADTNASVDPRPNRSGSQPSASLK